MVSHLKKIEEKIFLLNLDHLPNDLLTKIDFKQLKVGKISKNFERDIKLKVRGVLWKKFQLGNLK